jgi:hypothetical protein
MLKENPFHFDIPGSIFVIQASHIQKIFLATEDTEYTSRPTAATKEDKKLGSWEAEKKHKNCVRFSTCGEIMVRKKTAGKPHQIIDKTVITIKCCNKNKKLNDCSTELS